MFMKVEQAYTSHVGIQFHNIEREADTDKCFSHKN
jgi:hypothetical protein